MGKKNDATEDAAQEKSLEKSMVTVVAKQEKGRMRAGLRFTMSPATVEVTQEQMTMIEADPYLAIVPNP